MLLGGNYIKKLIGNYEVHESLFFLIVFWLPLTILLPFRSLKHLSETPT